MTKKTNLEEKREVLFEAVKMKTGHVLYEYVCPVCGKVVAKVIRERPCEHCGAILLQNKNGRAYEF